MDKVGVVCSLCNVRADVERGDSRSVREGYACANCHAPLRYRDQASAIVDEFGDGRQLSLKALAASGLMENKAIYEAAIGGYLRSYLMPLPGYCASYFWEDVAPGEIKNGVRCEDLRSLTFSDNSFDLVLTSDVFEHVFEPYRAFSDINRVLKPGGVHIFSIPTKWPLPDKTVTRCELKNRKVNHLLDPIYHRAGDGSDSLVVTDWGADMIQKHFSLGIKTCAIRRSLPVFPWHSNVTFVSRKLY